MSETSNPVLLFARVLLAQRHQGPFQERILCIGNAVEFVDLSASQFSSDQSLRCWASCQSLDDAG